MQFWKPYVKYEKTYRYQTCHNRKEKKLFSIKALVNKKFSIWKMFLENLLAMEMEKIKVKMNKPVYLGLSTLGISKT